MGLRVSFVPARNTPPHLPRPEAQHRFSGNAETVIEMNVVHAAHPGVDVLDADESPRERACDNDVYTASRGQAGAVAGNLCRPVTALGIMRQRAAPVVPLAQKLVFQFGVIDFAGDFSSAEQELGKRRPAMRGHRRPARTAAVKQRVAALGVLGESHDQAAIDFCYYLPFIRQTSRARASAGDAIPAAEVFMIRMCRQLDESCLGIDVVRIDIAGVVGTAHKLEGLGPTVILVIGKHFAYFTLAWYKDRQVGISVFEARGAVLVFQSRLVDFNRSSERLWLIAAGPMFQSLNLNEIGA